MKNFSFLVLAAAGLLMTACSDKDVVSDETSNLLPRKGDGYIRVSLSIPGAQNSTRAWAEDSQLADGKESEYGVTDAYLLLFEGANEASAKLSQIVTLSPFDNIVETTTDQVTVNSGDDFVTKIAKAPSSDLWALAVVNGANNHVISPSTEDGCIVNVNGNDIHTDVTLAELQDIITMTVGASETYANKLSFVSSTSGNIFMSNAVLFDKQGGTKDPGAAFNGHTLVKINQDYIYETQEAAETGEKAADIYVERGVAKVTIKGKTVSSTINNLDVNVKEYDNTSAVLTATIEKWALTNTNLVSHDVRVVPSTFTWNLASKSLYAGTDKFRFVGNTAVDTPYGTAIAGYRTYWAEDPNYNDGAIDELYTAKDADFITGIGEENPLYCFENTFDVDHQTVKNTTCAIVKVVIKVGGEAVNLYTIGENKKTLYTKSDVEKLAATRLFSIPAFASFFEENHADGVLELGAGDVTLTFNTNAAGAVTVASATIKASKLKEGAATAVSSEIISALNNPLVMGNIVQYKDGEAYYYVRIKHFGDDLTPWNRPADDKPEWDTSSDAYAPAESDVASIYPAGSDTRRDANYLGRYGVVRNNWYELQLNNIVAMGSATLPNLTTEEHPDDEIEDLYIKCRINILSWAKRPQNWNLKK